jgi:hypothetical protein
MLHLIAMYTSKAVQAVVSYVYIVTLSYHSDRRSHSNLAVTKLVLQVRDTRK